MCEPAGKFGGIHRISTKSGESFEALIVPFNCNKWSCPKCGSKKIRQLYARALNGVIAQHVKGFRPQYSHKLLTLTLPGKEFREKHTPEEALDIMIENFNKMNRALRKKIGAKYDYMRILEFHQDGYPHLHVILRGGAIAPKSILNEFRYYWTEFYGMGNVDLQKMKSKDPKGMIKYTLKYVTKHIPHLPKGKRLYVTSRGAIVPPKPPVHRDWIVKGTFKRHQCLTDTDQFSKYQSPELYGFMQCGDKDIAQLLLKRFRQLTATIGVCHDT